MENKRIEFKEKDNIAYIGTKENKLIIEKNKNNLTEILCTKNNIDFIFDKISNIKNKKNKLNFFEVIKVPLVTLIMSIIFTYSIFLTHILVIQIALGLISFKFLIMSGVTLKDWIKIKRNLNLTSELQMDFLEKECEGELEKLKELESISKDKTVETVNNVVIPKSEKIEDLKHKLLLIKKYIINKDDYLYLYNNSLLNNLMEMFDYNGSDIDFIKYIIEQDLQIDNNTKSNQLKLKK